MSIRQAYCVHLRQNLRRIYPKARGNSKNEPDICAQLEKSSVETRVRNHR